MHSTSVKFPNDKGELLAGTIDFPDGTPKAFALFSHCFTGSRFTPCAARVCKTLAAAGIAALRFDYPGLGQSEGNFADTSFTSNVDDLVAAYRWLEENYEAPQLLIGHSLGGAAALRAGTRMPEVKAVATIGAPFDPAHAVLHFADQISAVDEHGAVTLTLGGRQITISREFLEDLAEVNPEEYIHKLRKPLLILHSPTDQTVGIDNAQKIFLVARYPKSLVALDKVDHLATTPGGAQRAGEIISQWASAYLSSASADAEPLPEGVAVATATRTGHYTDLVQAETSTFVTDREASLGGKKNGPSPTALIVSAVAAATSAALREAGPALGIPVDEVQVTCTLLRGDGTKPAVIRRAISLPHSEISDEQRAELVAAADLAHLRPLLGAVIEDV